MQLKELIKYTIKKYAIKGINKIHYKEICN